MTSLAKTELAHRHWPSLETESAEALVGARQAAVDLMQWLARIANSFVAADTQERRLTLTFRATDAAFSTNNLNGNLALQMRLPTLQMQFLENGIPVPHIMDPEGHSPAEIEAWLLVELLHRGADCEKFFKELPYDVSEPISGDAKRYSPQSFLNGLIILKSWLCNGAAVLTAAADSERVDIVCWPQNLNLSCLVNSKATNYGFSLGDADTPEPYFYVDCCGTGTSIVSKSHSILSASDFLGKRYGKTIAFLQAGNRHAT
jgi:hypothetical protein